MEPISSAVNSDGGPQPKDNVSGKKGSGASIGESPGTKAAEPCISLMGAFTKRVFSDSSNSPRLKLQ